MTLDERNEFYQQMKEEYGMNSMLYIAIEEMAELQKELTKILRGKGNCDNFIEEVADVEIMLEQLKHATGIPQEIVEEHKEYKIRRAQKEWLDK